jgi:hypothetical protein
MQTQITIANMALGLIGARTNIQNFNQQTPEANAVSLFYEAEFTALARTANWNCLRRQAALTLLKAAAWTPEGQSQQYPAPPVPWSYEYAIPSDCLRARLIVPWDIPQQPATTPPLTTNGPAPTPTNIGRRQAIKFVVSTDTDPNGILVQVLLANKPQAQLVYTADVQDPNLWDSMFVKAFTNTLGAFLVNPLGRNSALMKDMINVSNGLIAQARMTDGDEGITSADHLPDWIGGRFSSGGWGGSAGGSGWNWESYDRMCWPDASLY